jgi:hypothetical protein
MGHGKLWGYVPCFHCLCRIHSDSTLPSRARKKTTIKRDCARFAGLVGVCRLFPVLERWVAGPECCWRGFGRGRSSGGGRGVRPGSLVESQFGDFSAVREVGGGTLKGILERVIFFCPPSVGFFCPGFLWGRYLWLWCLLFVMVCYLLKNSLAFCAV